MVATHKSEAPAPDDLLESCRKARERARDVVAMYKESAQESATVVADVRKLRENGERLVQRFEEDLAIARRLLPSSPKSPVKFVRRKRRR